MQPHSASRPPVADGLPSHLVLPDGTAVVQTLLPGDGAAIRQFLNEIARESRHQTLLSSSGIGEPGGGRFPGAWDPSKAVTLVAWRQVADARRPIAVASYSVVGDCTADMALAVDGRLHEPGLATAMLERLAGVASSRGLRRFQAQVPADRDAMIDVFRDSGFELRWPSRQGIVDVRLDLAPPASGIAAMDERHRLSTLASMRALLQPASVAVIGVSRRNGGLGRRIFDGLIANGFRGAVYPVNNGAHEIDGRRAFSSVRDLPEPIDLAVVAVPGIAVLPVAEECADAGVRSLVVVSAGFAESGDEGCIRQRALVELARSRGMRLVGPNCLGVMNVDPGIRLNASLAERLPPHGRIALVSQSGGLGLTVVQLATERQIGTSTIVSLGNKADVSGNDLLQYGESDPGTSVILLYLSSFGNPRRFAQLARRIGRHKPIVVVQARQRNAGSSASSSDAAVSALFDQSGVIRAETIDEMFDVATCLDGQPLPGGARVGIVTNSEGPGILAADACKTAGLVVGEPAAKTRAELGANLTSQAGASPVIDLTAAAPPDAFRHAIQVMMSAGEVDALIVVCAPIDAAGAPATVDGIKAGIIAGRAAGASGKPVLVCLMKQPGRPTPIDTGAERVPTYAFPENAARALSKAASYAAWRRQSPGLLCGFDELQVEEARSLCQEIVGARGEAWLTTEELDRLLNAFGLPMAAGAVARTGEEAAAVAAIFGFPVALKLHTPRGLREKGGRRVRLNLATERSVRTAFSDIVRETAAAARMRLPARSLGVLIQPMFTGIETSIGLTEHPDFGPLVAFGMGSVPVEQLRDVAFRMAPLTDRDADALLRGVRGYQLLQGDSERSFDLEALREVLLRVSLIAQHIPEVVELDLNPVFALPEGHGCRIVDARVRVARRPILP